MGPFAALAYHACFSSKFLSWLHCCCCCSAFLPVNHLLVVDLRPFVCVFALCLLLPARSAPLLHPDQLFSSFQMANARSGIGVDDNCKLTFLELQRKKIHRYIVYKIDDKKEVVVERTGPPSESYDDFSASLPENECRYAVFDFDFVTEDHCQKSKIFFIAWSPDTSGIRTKFLYATSKDRFRKELDGVHYEVQATDPTELGIEVIRDRAN